MASEAPAAPATPAAAPAAAPAASAAAPAADKPAIDPSEAGRTLQQRRQAHMTALRDKAKAATEAKPAEKPAEPAPEAKKPAEEPDDDLAALMKEDRRLKTEAKTLETEKAAVKDVAEVAPLVRQAQKLVRDGKVLDAAKVILGEAAMKDLLWELLKENPEGQEGKEPDVKAVVRSELQEREREAQAQREREAAEARTKEDQRLVDVDRTAQQPGFAAGVAAIPSLKGIDTGTIEAFGKYAASAAKYFAEHKAEFRAVDRYGVTSLQLVEKAEAMRVERLKTDRNANPPNLSEVLKALDDDLLGHARELAGVQAPAAAARPVATYSSAFQQGAGTPPPAEERRLTVEERREAHRKALRERATG